MQSLSIVHAPQVSSLPHTGAVSGQSPDTTHPTHVLSVIRHVGVLPLQSLFAVQATHVLFGPHAGVSPLQSPFAVHATQVPSLLLHAGVEANPLQSVFVVQAPHVSAGATHTAAAAVQPLAPDAALESHAVQTCSTQNGSAEFVQSEDPTQATIAHA